MVRKDRIDMTDVRVGDLYVLGPGESYDRADGSTVQKWECLCACGNIVHVIGSNLRGQNTTKSCGCWRRKAGEGSLNRGYVMLYKPDHPNSWKNGLVYQHTLVMSEYLGRPLLPGESVHHANGDRSDNRLENLELWSSSQPAGQKVEDKVKWAREIIALYGEAVAA